MDIFSSLSSYHDGFQYFEWLIVEITTRLLSKDEWVFNTQIALFHSKANNHSPHHPNRSAVRRSWHFVKTMKTFICIKQWLEKSVKTWNSK